MKLYFDYIESKSQSQKKETKNQINKKLVLAYIHFHPCYCFIQKYLLHNSV